jgi:DNA-binding GntR family transcriptional regulator
MILGALLWGSYSLQRLKEDSMVVQTVALSETVGESAYRRIKTDVIFGRLAPGQKLKLEKMAQSYGASISTLREALNRLGSEGLVIAEGQRGFEVAPISADEFRQIAEMRELLECYALESAFEVGDLEWESRIVATHHKLAALEKKMLSGDTSQTELWKQCDWQFHHALISACGSKVLLDAHAAVYDKYLRYQMITVVFRGEAAAIEHQKLLEAGLRRDFPAARKLLNTHIHDCVKHVLAHGNILGDLPVAKAATGAGRKVSGKRR